MIAKFRNAGQTCVCANRIYVQRGVFDASPRSWRPRSRAEGRRRRRARGADRPADLAAALAKVEAHVADAIAHGAKAKVGGKRHPAGALFYEPTVLVGADATMKLAREETFGPVAPLFAFDTVDDVVAMANDTEFGLASYFYARDLSRVWKVAEALEYGMVGVNTGLISTAEAPFGGVKASGIGREGSKYGIDDYLTLKYVCLSV